MQQHTAHSLSHLPQLLISMQSEYFPIDSVVAAAGTQADRLMVIVSGCIRWESPCTRGADSEVKLKLVGCVGGGSMCDPADPSSVLAVLGPG